MANNIFAHYAPIYWAAGLPAIPLVYQNKRPAINRWQLYSDTFPTKEEQDAWMRAYAAGNIGLPMGPASGLVAIDVDTEDKRALEVLDDILPFSPWHRVGRKGRVQIYRWAGERTTRIKDEEGNMICEILSKGTQFVLPPSIHPDTKQPYTANGNLWEIAKSAPCLPPDFDRILKGALKDAGIKVSSGAGQKMSNYVPQGARDATMCWFAGLQAKFVIRGERSLLQTLGEMEAWVENFVEKVVGDPLTIEKAQAKLVEFVIKDVTSESRRALPLGWDEGLTDEDKVRLGLTFTEDEKSWSVQKVLDYLALEFERFPDLTSEGRMSAINVALDKISRANPNMTPPEEGLILKFIVNHQKGMSSVVDLKKQLQLLRRGDIAGETHQELAEACLAYLSKYGEIRFDASSFWQWRGAAWERCLEQDLLKLIGEQCGQYPAGRKQGDHAGILKVMKARASQPLRTSYIKGVNFANGYLNQDLELVPHNPEYGMTYTLPYRYMPERAGHMPMFDQFLNDSWASDPDYGDKLLALQEMIGVSLMGEATRYQRAFLLFGQPGAGKSVLASIMRGLLPAESQCQISPSDWSDRFMPANLFGKIVNFAGELSESRPIPGDVFKTIVGGEAIMVQHKNQNAFTLAPHCAHWFNSNHLPKTRDTSEGFTRRWVILEWLRRVDPSKQIADLDQQILDHEREAIVAWAIQGYKRLVEQGGYTLPTSHLALVDQMAADNNSVRHFLTSNGSGLKWGPDLKITLADLHMRYWAFGLAGGGTRVPMTKFSKMMKELAGALPFQVDYVGPNEVVYAGIGV